VNVYWVLEYHQSGEWKRWGVAHGKKATKKFLAEMREETDLEWRAIRVKTKARVEEW
jgi:hypothetical protein